MIWYTQFSYNKKMHVKHLALILILASFLRLGFLSSHPAGYTPDEASFGYDAFSLLKTGADQWGNKLPLVLQSFGDGKMPLLAYLVVPSVAIFGLSEFAVRLPNALLGVGAVYLTYLLTRRAFKNLRLALMSAFVLAVSPWHIALSRGAFEATLTTFFLTGGIYFFLNIKNSRKEALLAALFFGLNLFGYHAARFVTPFIVGLLMIYQFNLINRQDLKDKNLYIFVFCFSAFLSLMFLSMFVGANERLATSTILDANPPAEARFNALLSGLPPVLARIFNNRFLVVCKTFLDQYLQYFSPQFWFSQGAAEGTYGMLPGVGVLHLLELVFIFGFFINARKIKHNSWFICWLLLAPVPAALSRGPGYAANRAAIMLPALSIFLALGWENIYEILREKRKTIFMKAILAAYLLSMLYFAEKYFIQQKYEQSQDMVYGTRELFSYLSSQEAMYEQIIVSKSLSEPHIFYAFYSQMNPVKYQNATKNWHYREMGFNWVDQMPSYTLGKYVFTGMNYEKYSSFSDVLLVGRPEEFPAKAFVVAKIKYPDLTDAFWVVNPNTRPFAQQ